MRNAGIAEPRGDFLKTQSRFRQKTLRLPAFATLTVCVRRHAEQRMPLPQESASGTAGFTRQLIVIRILCEMGIQISGRAAEHRLPGLTGSTLMLETALLQQLETAQVYAVRRTDVVRTLRQFPKFAKNPA